ncbi:MAG: hypothetical protein J6R60_05555 [Clostridia bacterium]|nr:hypothetical protein [Clostridia bacterium]
MKNERNLKSGNSLKKLKKSAANSTHKNKKRINSEKVKKYSKIGAIVAAALAVVMLVGIITVSILNDEGIIMRGRSVKKSDDLSINGAMLTYIFWDNFNNSITGDYASYYKLQGITSADDLSLENPMEEGKLWWDHFADMAKETTSLMLTYAQYALDGGKGLSAEDIKLIDEEMKNMENAAAVYGQSFEEYLSINYGRGIRPDDVRDVLELMCLSNNGIELMYKDLEPTKDEINSFYSTNTNELKKADYYFFVLGISGKDVLTPEMEKYFSEKAEDISRSSSTEEFKQKITAYLIDYNKSLEAGDENKLNDKELEEYIKSELAAIEYMNDVYADEKDVDKWIFSDQRVAGDTYVNHQEGYGTYGIAYIVKPVYIDEKWEEIAKTKLLETKEEALLLELEEKYPTDLSKLTKVIAKLK